MKTLLKSCLFSACIMLMLGLAGQPAASQSLRTIAIQNGKLYVDGEAVPSEALPASLDLRDVVARYSFSGDVKPVLFIGDQYYTLDGRKLVEMQEAAPMLGSFSVSLVKGDDLPALDVLSGVRGSTTFKAFQERSPLNGTVWVSLPEVRLMNEQAEALTQRAHALQTISTRLTNSNGSFYATQLGQYASQLNAQAEATADLAQQMPRILVREYLSDIQQSDRDLYRQLVSERSLENETIQLAARIRTMAEGKERQALTQKLHDKLDAIFDVKQNNRRLEIGQLESRLKDLHERLAERERLRDQIIDRRIEELLGGQRDE